MKPPRNIAGQVVRGDDLWGRDADLSELWRKVERGSLLLTAPRRYGKTSLMYAMRDRPEPGWDVVYLNVEYVSDSAEFANELVARVLARRNGRAFVEGLRTLPAGVGRWLAGVIDEVEAGVPDVAEVKLKLREQAPSDWQAALEPLWRAVAASEPKVLVILDEFPVMLTTMLERDVTQALRFLHWFRALRQQGGRVVVGGSVNIEPVLAELGQSALLNDLDRVRVLPFPRARAEAFVTAVFHGENQVVPDRLAQAMLDRIDTGVPFFLQVFIDELLGEAKRRQVLPSAALAAEVLDEAVLGPRCIGRFSHYLERLRTYGTLETAARQVLHEAAAHDRLSLGRFAELSREGAVDPGRLLTRLQSDWYIERDGEDVRFADGFVRKWWRRNAPMGRAW